MPPVIVIGHPEVVFNVFKQRITLHRTSSSDVHLGLLRLLQLPDDEMPIPTDLTSARACECVIVQPVAGSKNRFSLYFDFIDHFIDKPVLNAATTRTVDKIHIAFIVFIKLL